MKYEYTYKVNNEIVDSKTFRYKLMDYFMVCDTNYDNPLLNISYLDEKNFNSYMRKLKSQSLHQLIFVGGDSFKIERKLLNR